MRCDRLWTNARLATMTSAGAYGTIENGVLAAVGERIVWVGPRRDAPSFEAAETFDCDGRWITPGLIDCHTHLVFGGDRAREFEMRAAGARYEQIAQAGGGILSTVRATRAASEDELLAAAQQRLDRLIAEGVTLVEVKSGYGLDVETEIRMLRAARRLQRASISTTFLGAHALPPEYADRRDAYVDLVCGPMLEAVADLADAVDVFCERIAFTPDETRRIFEAARARGLRLKIHAEQLSNSGGAALAATYGAVSADHLEWLDPSGIAAMAQAGTASVLLPGAFYYLRETRAPPVDALRRANVPIALATDLNPGSSPINSLLTILNMGCVLFGLTPEEALAGVTRNAARALGFSCETGTLEAGKRCDLAIWDINAPGDLAYPLGVNPLHRRVWRGR